MKWKIWLVMLALVFSGGTMAQEICPALVRAAFETAAQSCTALARNQACYGNVLLEVEAQPDAPPLTFEQAGDIADLGHIARLSLSSMDTAAETWGMAMLRTQANLPDTLPGQNVTMILFGEVEMTDAAPPVPEAEPEPEPVLLDVTASGNINVRGGPSTNNAIVASLSANVTVTADGRNPDGSWLRVQLADGSLGWVFAQLVSVDGDASTLPEVDASAPPVEAAPPVPTYTPMQAFYFTSAIGDSPCAEAPDSGILIQTPQGAGTINLLVNGVEIDLGSTGYIQAQPGGEMTINIIEGRGAVSAFDRRVTVPAGARARVPLDENGAASGEPIGPEPYDEAAFNALPLLLLPDTVTVAPALTDAVSDLAAGEWTALAEFDWPCDSNLPSYSFALNYDPEVGFEVTSMNMLGNLPGDRFDDDSERLDAEEYLGIETELALWEVLDYIGGLNSPASSIQELTIESPASIRAVVASSVLEHRCDVFVNIAMRFTGNDSQESAAPGELYVGQWTITTTECAGTLLTVEGYTAPVEYRRTTNVRWGYWAYDDATYTYTDAGLNVASLMASGIAGELGAWESDVRGEYVIPGNYTSAEGALGAFEFEIESSTRITGIFSWQEFGCTVEFTLEAAG